MDIIEWMVVELNTITLIRLHYPEMLKEGDARDAVSAMFLGLNAIFSKNFLIFA